MQEDEEPKDEVPEDNVLDEDAIFAPEEPPNLELGEL